MPQLSDNMFLYHGSYCEIKIPDLSEADADWLHCVVGHRKENIFPMVVEELAMESGRSPDAVLKDFISSKTGALLYDEPSKLWWNGPAYITEMYRKECEEKECGAERKI